MASYLPVSVIGISSIICLILIKIYERGNVGPHFIVGRNWLEELRELPEGHTTIMW